MHRCLAALAALMLASCGGGSPRLSPSFVAVHNTMAAMGLSQSGAISEGSLPEGGVARFATQLRAGECYTIAAFGGDGVGDLDLAVLDETGAVLATDRTTDAQAALQVCPELDAEYQVVLTMARGNGTYIVSSWSGSGQGAAGATAGTARGSCRAPIPLQVGTPVRGDTQRGVNAMTGTCIGWGDAPERVYQLTLERRSHVSVTLDSGYDGAVYLLASCGDLRSEIACNDDAPHTRRSHIEATLDPGRYFVVVDGWGHEAGEFELLVQASELQELAQVCQSAPALVPGQAVTGRTQGQPSYFTATCAGGARSPDRVYSLDVPSRSRVRVRMQASYDGALYMRSDCADPNTELACNDDWYDIHHSMITATVDPGRYYIFADGYSNFSSGDFSLRADVVPVTGGGATPADSCSSAGAITPGVGIDVDTFPATDDLEGSCGGRGAPDVVYRFEVQNRSRVKARLADSEMDGVLYIQRSCGQASTEVVCTRGSRRYRGAAELEMNLQPGTYFLVVDGVNPDDVGSATLTLEMEDLAALEASCRQAPRLRPGRTVSGDTSGAPDRFQASCAGGARSGDLVYQLLLQRRSRVRINSTQRYDGALYIRRDCTDPSSEVACNDDAHDNRHSSIDVVLDRGTYYVFVDGYGARSEGPFTLDVDVTRP